MTELKLIPNYNLDSGPLSLHLQDDGPGEVFDWEYAYENGIAHQRKDSQDCLNADRTWGPEDVGAEGGSEIAFAGGMSNLQAVTVAARAKHNRKNWFNREHRCRQWIDDFDGWDMTHGREFGTRILEYADAELADLHGYGPQGVVSIGTPENVPNNIHQYHEMAVIDPHSGSPMNGREAGWCFYLEAMALKVQPRRNRAYAEMALETCELAAFVGSGQICCGKNTGGGPLDQENVVYAFHQTILAIGASALAFRLDRGLPYWVLDWAESLWAQRKSYDYYGSPSSASFYHTQQMALVPATGPGQHGDPAFAWWSSLCVTIWRFTHNYEWIERAKKWGPTTAADEQSRKFSMLYRGVDSIPRAVPAP